MNFEPFFKQYEQLVHDTDTVFSKIKSQYTDCVRCNVGCCDCCFALFDVTLIEALYINHHFKQKIDPEAIRVILERAETADRQIAKIKRQAYKQHESGKSEKEIFEEMSAERVRCPALAENNQCAIYEFRPITCRLYGIPTAIGETTHTCGISGFEPGNAYPTVKMDVIHQKLYEISFALANALKSRYAQLAELLVPLSMALLTDYTQEYLGISEPEQQNKQNEA